MILHAEDWKSLLEATRAVASTLKLSDLLETMTRAASDVVKAEAASVLLIDAATGELYFDVALGEKSSALQRIRLKKGEGIAGWVAEQQKPAVVNDVSKDPRWTQKGDQASQFVTRSILAVPMQIKGRLIGVMEAINREGGLAFSDEDVELLETFASQAAVAIENARLFESIRQEKEKMATILGEMGEGVVLLDPEGKILLSNPAARTLLGQEIQEGIFWQTLESLFEIKPAWRDIPTALGGAGGLQIMRKSPLLIMAGVVNQICDDKGKVTGYLAVFANVTEERKEAQLKRNFLSLVSHKLKTPLVSLRGFTPMLLEKPEELNAFQKTAMEAIDRNSQLLASLVDKLVWFAALEAETFEMTRKPQTASTLIDTALADLASYLRQAPAQVTQENLITLPAVQADKVWVKEAFRNLIENAIKFNPKPERWVKIKGRQDNDMVEIIFEDNGPGMPSEELQKIFQKFYQIESSFTGQVQGMGLGLALAKRVAEEHGGSLKVESTLGQGSRFIFKIPI